MSASATMEEKMQQLQRLRYISHVQDHFWTDPSQVVTFPPDETTIEQTEFEYLREALLWLNVLEKKKGDRYDEFERLMNHVTLTVTGPDMANVRECIYLTLTVWMELDHAKEMLSFCIHDPPDPYTLGDSQTLLDKYKLRSGSKSNITESVDDWHVVLRLLYLNVDPDLYHTIMASHHRRHSSSTTQESSVQSVYFGPIEEWAKRIPAVLAIVDPKEVPESVHMPTVRLPACPRSVVMDWVKTFQPSNSEFCLQWIVRLWTEQLIVPKYLENLAYYLVQDMHLANFVPMYGAAILTLETFLPFLSSHKQDAYTYTLWFLCVQFYKAFFFHTMIECDRIFSTYAWTQEEELQKRVYQLAHVRMQQIIDKLSNLWQQCQWVGGEQTETQLQDNILSPQILSHFVQYQRHWLNIAKHMHLQDRDGSPRTVDRLDHILHATNLQDPTSQWYGQRMLHLVATTAFLCDEYLNMAQWPILLQKWKDACDATGTHILGPEISTRTLQNPHTLLTIQNCMGLFHFETSDPSTLPFVQEWPVVDLHKYVFCLVLQKWLLSQEEDTKDVIYRTLVVLNEGGDADPKLATAYKPLVDFMQDLVDCHMIEMLCDSNMDLDIQLSDQAFALYNTLPSATLLNMLSMIRQTNASLGTVLPMVEEYISSLEEWQSQHNPQRASQGRSTGGGNPQRGVPSAALSKASKRQTPRRSGRVGDKRSKQNSLWKLWGPFWDLEIAKLFV